MGYPYEKSPKIKTYHVSGAVTGNITLSSKGKTGENNVIEDVEDDIDELPDSYFSKTAARVFDEIGHGKASVLPLSKFLI